MSVVRHEVLSQLRDVFPPDSASEPTSTSTSATEPTEVPAPPSLPSSTPDSSSDTSTHPNTYSPPLPTVLAAPCSSSSSSLPPQVTSFEMLYPFLKGLSGVPSTAVEQWPVMKTIARMRKNRPYDEFITGVQSLAVDLGGHLALVNSIPTPTARENSPSIAADLPHELLLRIFEFVDTSPALYACALTCRSWSQVAVSVLWRTVVMAEFPTPRIGRFVKAVLLSSAVAMKKAALGVPSGNVDQTVQGGGGGAESKTESKKESASAGKKVEDLDENRNAEGPKWIHTSQEGLTKTLRPWNFGLGSFVKKLVLPSSGCEYLTLLVVGMRYMKNLRSVCLQHPDHPEPGPALDMKALAVLGPVMGQLTSLVIEDVDAPIWDFLCRLLRDSVQEDEEEDGNNTPEGCATPVTSGTGNNTSTNNARGGNRAHSNIRNLYLEAVGDIDAFDSSFDLAEIWPNMPLLSFLRLDGIPVGPNATIDALVASCGKNLRAVTLDYCIEITMDVMVILWNGCENLEFLGFAGVVGPSLFLESGVEMAMGNPDMMAMLMEQAQNYFNAITAANAANATNGNGGNENDGTPAAGEPGTATPPTWPPSIPPPTWLIPNPNPSNVRLCYRPSLRTLRLVDSDVTDALFEEVARQAPNLEMLRVVFEDDSCEGIVAVSSLLTDRSLDSFTSAPAARAAAALHRRPSASTSSSPASPGVPLSPVSPVSPSAQYFSPFSPVDHTARDNVSASTSYSSLSTHAPKRSSFSSSSHIAVEPPHTAPRGSLRTLGLTRFPKMSPHALRRLMMAHQVETLDLHHHPESKIGAIDDTFLKALAGVEGVEVAQEGVTESNENVNESLTPGENKDDDESGKPQPKDDSTAAAAISFSFKTLLPDSPTLTNTTTALTHLRVLNLYGQTTLTESTLIHVFTHANVQALRSVCLNNCPGVTPRVVSVLARSRIGRTLESLSLVDCQKVKWEVCKAIVDMSVWCRGWWREWWVMQERQRRRRKGKDKVSGGISMDGEKDWGHCESLLEDVEHFNKWTVEEWEQFVIDCEREWKAKVAQKKKERKEKRKRDGKKDKEKEVEDEMLWMGFPRLKRLYTVAAPNEEEINGDDLWAEAFAALGDNLVVEWAQPPTTEDTTNPADVNDGEDTTKEAKKQEDEQQASGAPPQTSSASSRSPSPTSTHDDSDKKNEDRKEDMYVDGGGADVDEDDVNAMRLIQIGNYWFEDEGLDILSLWDGAVRRLGRDLGSAFVY
ncbi:hypothetical protein HK102_013931 [Quaeritorhiza haematococci]|nr:hypothetical protein HK102_013931 [Quaeritorhiza haematococci]